MLKDISTWVRSRVLRDEPVVPRADVATEQWDEVPFAAPLVRAQPQAIRRATPPPLPPAATEPRLTPLHGEPARWAASAPVVVSPAGAGAWQEELLALARSTVSPVDPADVPTPPPMLVAPAALPTPATPPRPEVAPPTLAKAPAFPAADEPTPPPTAALPPLAAPRSKAGPRPSPPAAADVPTPPPTLTRRKAPPPPPAPSGAVSSEDEDWDAVIARAKSGPVKSRGSRL
jgi:WAS/WASL-interacting protein